MSGHRQAAVALHGLAGEDRDLILAALPPADQATLRGHLQELQALGFEATPDLLTVAAAPPAGVAERLAQATPAAMYAVLGQEPAALIAQFLAMREWRWSAGLLALCPPSRRELIRAAAPAPIAPARRRVLMAAVARRLDAHRPQAGGTPSPGWLAPLLRRVATWTR